MCADALVCIFIPWKPSPINHRVCLGRGGAAGVVQGLGVALQVFLQGGTLGSGFDNRRGGECCCFAPSLRVWKRSKIPPQPAQDASAAAKLHGSLQ